MIKISTICIGSVACLSSTIAFAQNTPWINDAGESSVNVSYAYQTADEFYIGEAENTLPADLSQSTIWFDLSRGLGNNLAINLKTGFSRSDFDGAAPDENRDGITDTNIGLTWRFLNEFESNSGLPTMALNFGITAQGSYDPGFINSVGDGANSVELAYRIGKFVTPWLGFTGEAGFRARDTGVPNDAFYEIGGFAFLNEQITVNLNYSNTDAQSGENLGPGFSGVFPSLEEDVQLVEAGINFEVNEAMNLTLTAAQVLDGKNTAKSEALIGTVGFNF